MDNHSKKNLLNNNLLNNNLLNNNPLNNNLLNNNPLNNNLLNNNLLNNNNYSKIMANHLKRLQDIKNEDERMAKEHEERMEQFNKENERMIKEHEERMEQIEKESERRDKEHEERMIKKHEERMIKEHEERMEQIKKDSERRAKEHKERMEQFNKEDLYDSEEFEKEENRKKKVYLAKLEKEDLEKMKKEERRLEISDELRSIRMMIVEENKKTEFLKSKRHLSTLIDLYKEKRSEIKKYLPKIKDLLVDGILFVIVNVHGGVDINRHNTYTGRLRKYLLERYGIGSVDYIQIPKSMILFKAMSSDYGASSCMLKNDRLHGQHSEIINAIHKNIKDRTHKGTRRNNIKFMKKTMKEINTIINNDMEKRKSHKTRNVPNNVRYLSSKSHIHSYMNNGKIVKKIYDISLVKDDVFDNIYVISNTYYKVDLLHYIDVDIFDHYISIDMQDIFDLFKRIKYVFFVDESCSNATSYSNFVQNTVKHKAEALEGKSITKNIENYNNISPYNTNNVYETERQQTGPSRTQEENNRNNEYDRHMRKGIPLVTPNAFFVGNTNRANSNYTTHNHYFFSRKNANLKKSFKKILQTQREEKKNKYKNI
jgi:hypothetical protein